MIIETHLDRVLEQLLGSQPRIKIGSTQLIQCIDLTLLDDKASPSSLLQLEEQAKSNKVAAVCVFPKHLNEFQLTDINLATVINFPDGNNSIDNSLSEIKQAIAFGATEIDYVLPYTHYLAGHRNQALDSCNEIAQQCKSFNVPLKIILETGVFEDSLSIYELSLELIKTGCDFLKTSTGKAAQGATLSAVFAMLSAIKDSSSSCGIKVSGGVRTSLQAFNYAFLAELMLDKVVNKQWFRIGASSLLNDLLNNAQNLDTSSY